MDTITESAKKLYDVPLDLIKSNKANFTRTKVPDLADLMASMKRRGQLQPITLVPYTDSQGNRFYTPKLGNMRLRAAGNLGWETICAEIDEQSSTSDPDFDVDNFAENFARTNPTQGEYGLVFKKYADTGMSQKEIAARFSCSEKTVANALKIMSLVPAKFKGSVKNRLGGQRVQKGEIPATVATKITDTAKRNSTTAEARERLFELASEGMSVSKLNQLVKLVNKDGSKEDKVDAGRVMQIAKMLTSKLKVNIELLVDKAEISDDYGGTAAFKKAVKRTLKNHMELKTLL